MFISYYRASNPIATIQGYLKAGYNSGAWNGVPTASTGVITSAALPANAGYAIGYADSADGVVSGQQANTIELKYTLAGDLALTGTVNSADFANAVADYGTPEAWDGGAITYGVTVGFAHFALTVDNYGKQTVTTTGLAALNAATFSEAISTASSSTPRAPTSKVAVASIAPVPVAGRKHVSRPKSGSRHQ